MVSFENEASIKYVAPWNPRSYAGASKSNCTLACVFASPENIDSCLSGLNKP